MTLARSSRSTTSTRSRTVSRGCSTTRLGEPSSGFHPKAVHETHSVAPEEGMLVLFPSYFHHRTEPFEGSPARISLAFDLIPAQ